MNKSIFEYCRSDEANQDRWKYLHPIAVMIFCDLILWCEENNLPCVMTDSVSDEAEDRKIQRMSDTHRTRRAFDISLNGWGDIQKNACIQAMTLKWNKYAALGGDGRPRLCYGDVHGTGPHIHFQINRKYSLPVLDFQKKETQS
jgi:hypothetical protein